MSKIIHWYNTNRKKFFTTIIIIAFIIIIIKILNSIAEQNLKNKKQIAESNIEDEKKITNSISMESTESAISGEELSIEQTNSLKILDDFINYCINGDIANAYNLLSQECKEEMYPSQDYFEKGYYALIFNGSKKDVSAENWIGNTYKVKFVEDPLATGSYNSNSSYQDYITIVEDENGESKLNINRYIGRKKLDAVAKSGDIEIKVTETNVYMDYQTLSYEITNGTDRKIMMTEPNIVNALYIEDSNGVKYQPYMHELSQADFKIIPNETRKLTIKYYSQYVSNKVITKAVFNRIITNYAVYEQMTNKAYYGDYKVIEVKL